MEFTDGHSPPFGHVRRERRSGIIWKPVTTLLATMVLMGGGGFVPGSQAKADAIFDRTAPDCRGSQCRVLTPCGWGGIEAGATVDRAERSSGMKLKDDGSYDGECRTFAVVGGPANVWLIVEKGIVSTVEAVDDGKGDRRFRTDRGVGLGDPESAVRAAYKDLKQLPDIYSEPPDKKLFHYEPGGERGIKFSIVGGKVQAITVGTQSIEYVEACS